MRGAEDDFRPRPFGLTDFEERTLFHFEKLKESLQWKEGHPPDPYEVHQVLNGIAINTQPASDLGEVGPPDHEAFTENIRKVRDAFLVDAYPFMNERQQVRLRMTYVGRAATGNGEFTLTLQQKHMLTMITTAAGIPDKPDQLTYSFSGVFRPSAPENGQGKVRR